MSITPLTTDAIHPKRVQNVLGGLAFGKYQDDC